MLVVALFLASVAQPSFAELIDGDLAEEQAKEKEEIKDMKKEMGNINSTIDDALGDLNDLSNQLKQRQNQEQNAKEFHLFARESDWETYSGSTVRCLTYNGKIPGPAITVTEGDFVKIVLHNQMKTSTSLQFHGIISPHSVSGIPRSGAGLVEPNQSFAYQFIAKQAGTFWYHPQLVHPNQKQLGLYGAIIVNPKMRSKPYDQDITLIFSEMRKTNVDGSAHSGHSTHATSHAGATASTTSHRGATRAGRSGTSSTEEVKQETAGHNYTALAWTHGSIPPSVETDYLINGKPAPNIPAIELRKGQRIRVRLINAGQEAVPLQLGGHRMEIIAQNGGDRLEPHTFRDTITLNPSERIDIDFSANNPGVWSLASESAHQSTNKGKFPGGMACILRYSELKARQSSPQPPANQPER